jgi:hypothetical protein
LDKLHHSASISTYGVVGVDSGAGADSGGAGGNVGADGGVVGVEGGAGADGA